jgi:hypothetical protein
MTRDLGLGIKKLVVTVDREETNTTCSNLVKKK